MVGKNMLKLVASNPVLIFSKKNEKMCYGGGGYGESSYTCVLRGNAIRLGSVQTARSRALKSGLLASR